LQAGGSWTEGVLGLDSAALELGSLLSVRGSGRIEPETRRYDLDLEIPETKIAPLARTFIQDPLSLSRPELSAMLLEGLLALRTSIRGDSGGLGIEVRLSLINARAGELVGQMNLDLPFAYSFGASGPRQTEEWGSLSLDLGLPWANATLDGLRLRLSANELTVPQTVELPLPGGLLEFGSLRVSEPLSSGFSVQGLAGLRSLDLSAVPAGGFSLEGRLSGPAAPFRMDRRELTWEGKLDGGFFGGRLTATKLGALLPLDPGRTLRANLECRNLVLERFSNALGIGRITGLLHFDLHNLEAAYGQPTDFEFRAWTPKADDTDHTISLKAVNAISVMGTGSGLSGIGISMFSSLFKEFSYDRIGMYCELTNDVFQVRGLISEGGVEYLIKKPPLFGINVINANPDNRISFSDMLDRVKRVVQPGSSQEPQEGQP